MSTTKTVQYTQWIEVEVDESKFDDKFMAEFRESFYPFWNLHDHIEHLGQLFARGIYDHHDFIEGYGPAAEMGIKFKWVGAELETLEQAA